MSESPNPEPESLAEPASQDSGGKKVTAPYETALNKAFDRLTSQIFIFLLAYTILLIGMTVLGKGIPTDLRNLLYVIPVLGIVAYGWLRKRSAIRDPQAKGIQVRASVVGRGAYVGGVRGPGQVPSGNVDVSGGIISGTVVGVDQGSPQMNNTSQFILSVFEELGRDDQNALIQQALRLQRKGKST